MNVRVCHARHASACLFVARAVGNAVGRGVDVCARSLVVVGFGFARCPVPFLGVRLCCWCSPVTHISYASVLVLSGWNRWRLGWLEFLLGLVAGPGAILLWPIKHQNLVAL